MDKPESTAPHLLSEIIDTDILQSMQDRLARLARVSLCVADPEGRRLTRPSPFSPVCRWIEERSLPSLADVETTSRVTRFDPGDIPEYRSPFRCPSLLLELRAPLIVEGKTLAQIIASDGPNDEASPVVIQQLAEELQIDPREVEGGIAGLSRWTHDRKQSLENLLHLQRDALAVLWGHRLELRHRLEELSTVYELTGMLAGTDRLQDILDAVAVRVCEVLKVKACSVRLLEEETGELVVKAVHNLSARYLQKVRVKLGENPIDTSAFNGEIVYFEDAAVDPRIRYPEEAKAEGIVSGLCVPMTYRGRTVGVLRIYTDHKMRFSPAVQALARAVASQAAAAIVTARSNADRRAAEHYQQQLRTAGEIQRRMIPSVPMSHGRLSFAAVYEPSLEVGGDFYDFLELPKGNVGVCIADVVGKGIGAGLMMASVRAALRAHAESIYHIDTIVSRVNRHLCHDTLLSEFATLFYGVFSADGKRFTYCNAGHDPPLLLREGKIIRLETGGTVIGLRPDAVFERDVVELESGDSLIFYTDGIVEARNYEGRLFGRDRLDESLLRCAGKEANTMAQELLWDVRRFVGLARQSDDISLVVAKVR